MSLYLASISLNTVDIIIIAIVALFAIIGFIRGFLNSFISLFGNIASLAVAIIICKPACAFIDGIFNLTGFLTGKIAEGLVTTLPEITNLTGEQIVTAMNEQGLSFLDRLIVPFIDKTTTFATTADLAAALGNKVAALAALVITAIGLFILVRIAVLLLSKLFNSISKSRALSGLDRLLGLVLGTLKGALIVAVILAILYVLNSIPVIGNLLNTLQESVIVQWAYGHIAEFFTWLVEQVDFNNLIINWLGTTSSSVSAETSALISL